jgi:hypothetical protein
VGAEGEAPVTYRLVLDRAHQHRAVCSCGWTSEPVSAAGLAGAAWDVHRDGDHATE